MHNALPHLTKSQITKLAALVQKIVQVISPEKIICYGSRTHTFQDWTCFWEGDGYKECIFPTTYDLLVITGEVDKRPEHDIIEIIEQQAEAMACNVTSIAQKITAVNEALASGSRFFTTIFHKGLLLYNGSGIPLTTPLQELGIDVIQSNIEAHWGQCFGLAQRFFTSAAHCLQDGWPEQAVFNLHQCVQHTCMALIRAFTGYRSNTHNLSRLLALVENFSFVPSTVFPCLTKEETHLFQLLSKAYSDARYNEQYTISADIAKILTERVKELLTIAEQLYKQKLLDLKESQPISFPVTTHA